MGPFRSIPMGFSKDFHLNFKAEDGPSERLEIESDRAGFVFF